MSAGWDRARAVADAVLHEGYLLYPYRATSGKNQSRWQFGVLGPPGAEQAGIGENDAMTAQLLVEPHGVPSLSGAVRFLQLQRRSAERGTPDGYRRVDELQAGARRWLSWDEAVQCEVAIDAAPVSGASRTVEISIPAGRDVEAVAGGRLVRERRSLHGRLAISVEPCDGLLRLTLEVRNTAVPAADKRAAVATSLIGTHLLLRIDGADFVSLLEPPGRAAEAAGRCVQHRCFPVLAGRPGERDLTLVSPIILYDHPEIAEQSQGDLYDACEIDEILTLRVMTMTDEEKSAARATDPRAAEIIDRCEVMSPEALLGLHGVLRDPHACAPPLIPEIPADTDWWDPRADTAVRPELDAVLVNGTRVARGSRVRLHPSRRADAQDLFYADKLARVTSVHADVDGGEHIGVVLDEDSAADLHDWYGRHLYFAPDEVEPLVEGRTPWK